MDVLNLPNDNFLANLCIFAIVYDLSNEPSPFKMLVIFILHDKSEVQKGKACFLLRFLFERKFLGRGAY